MPSKSTFTKVLSCSLSRTLSLSTVLLVFLTGPASAQSASCIGDTTKPVISGCPAHIVIKTGPGNTSGTLSATWTPPTATDDCSAVTMTSTHEPGDEFPKGITSVTYTFTDASNNSSTCSFFVCVKDNTPPVISGLPNITAYNEPGKCSAAVPYARPAFTDNAPRCNALIEQLEAAGFRHLGTFRDHDYFRSPVRGSWDGIDSIAQMVGGYMVAINDAAEDSFLHATNKQIAWMGLTDRDSETHWVWSNGEPATYRNWCWGQPDDWKSLQNYGVLNSQGLQGPSGCWDDAHSPGRIEVEVPNSIHGIIEIAGCGSISLTSGPDSGGVFQLGTTPVTWTAIDASGNKASKTFHVTVVDSVMPAIICPASLTLPYNSNTEASEAGTGVATATDNCSVPVVTSSEVSTQVADIRDPRHYNYKITRTWRAKDAGNNISTADQVITVRDTIPPVAICTNKSFTLAVGANSITPADINNGSFDLAGPIASMSLSRSSFSCAEVGANPVTLTVKDVSGNSSVCTATVYVTVGVTFSSSIAVTPSSTVNTGGIATNIYLGYGPQQATLTASSTISGPLTYSWSGPTSRLSCTTCQSPVFSPIAAGSYTFTVTVSDAYGCTSNSSVTFCVKDIRVPSVNSVHDTLYDDQSGNRKVYVRHVPHGNPSGARVLAISTSAVAGHFGTHTSDALGLSNQTCGTNARMLAEEIEIATDEVKVYPNPANGSFIVELPYIEEEARIIISDVQGRVVRQKTVLDGEDYKVRFDLGGIGRGIYFVDVTNGEHRLRTKLVVQ